MRINESRPQQEPQARPQYSEVGPPVPLDPECAVALGAVQDTLIPALELDLIPHLRQISVETNYGISDADISGLDGDYRVEERKAPGFEGAPDVALLLCLPNLATATVPVLYYMHGGGMVTNNRRTNLNLALELARHEGAAVVSVEYRLTPENPHPAPIEDCYAGLVWIVENATELGIDPNRVVLVGQSAGGNLVTALALLARDRNGPALLGQMAFTPMLDDRNDTPSALQYKVAAQREQYAMVTSHDYETSETLWNALLGDRRGGPDISPYASPSRAECVAGLPPAFLDVGSAEPFRDEVTAYATRIWQAGGVAELHVWPGGFHGFEFFAPNARISKGTMHTRHKWLRGLLSSAASDS